MNHLAIRAFWHNVSKVTSRSLFRVHLAVSVLDKIWNRVEHNLSESLHNSLPITVLLSLSPVKINGLIITAPDTFSSLVLPWALPGGVSNGVTL